MVGFRYGFTIWLMLCHIFFSSVLNTEWPQTTGFIHHSLSVQNGWFIRSCTALQCNYLCYWKKNKKTLTWRKCEEKLRPELMRSQKQCSLWQPTSSFWKPRFSVAVRKRSTFRFHADLHASVWLTTPACLPDLAQLSDDACTLGAMTETSFLLLHITALCSLQPWKQTFELLPALTDSSSRSKCVSKSGSQHQGSKWPTVQPWNGV